MAKLAVLLAILVAIAASPSFAKVTPPREVPGFIYLGTANTTDGRQTEDHWYYTSVITEDWSTALDDCKIVFGPSAHLLSIESAAEQEFIFEWLRDRSDEGTTSFYWTSGQFDVSLTWTWAATGESIDNLYANWGPDEPSAEFGAARIALEHQNQVSGFWVSRQYTEIHRYVCEYPGESPSTTVQY